MTNFNGILTGIKVLEEKVVNSRASEMHQFMSAYRASDEIMRQYPTESDKW